MIHSATTTTSRALMLLVLGLALTLGSDVQAQTIIEPGSPGTINQAILGDTTATGERNSCHYVLRRDAVYIYNQRISMRADCEWIIEAEDGSGARPIIRPAAFQGGEEAPRQFHLFANTTLTLRDLYLDGYDVSLPDPGRPSDNAIVRIGADSARVIVDNVRFDRNRQSAIRTDNQSTKVYISNSEFSNIYNDTRPDQSYVFDTRGNPADSVVFVNNTIWNHAGQVVNNADEFNYIKFDHNTFVNIGGAFNASGRLDTLRVEEPGEQDVGVIALGQAAFAVFRNNLLVNVGLVGTETNEVFTPRFIIDIDSTLSEVDSVTFTMEPPQGVDIRNNVFSFDESIASAYPDTIRLFTADEVYDPTADLFIEAQGTSETLLATDLELNSAPEADPAYVTDYWDFAVGVREREVLFFPRDTRNLAVPEGDLDFAYPTSALAYTAGTDGMPVGDLNWFGMAEGYTSGPDEFAVLAPLSAEDGDVPEAFRVLGNYPNPFNPATTIRFHLPAVASVSVEVYDMLGRRVLALPAATFTAGEQALRIDGAALASGAYLYRLRADLGLETRMATGRMVLLK